MTNEEAADQVWSELVAEHAQFDIELTDDDRAEFEETLYFWSRVSNVQSEAAIKALKDQLEPHVETLCRWALYAVGAVIVFHAIRWALS